VTPPTIEPVKIPFKVCFGNADADGTVLPFIPALRFSYMFPIIEINANPTILPNFVLDQSFFGIGILIFDPVYIAK
jgi:hypothetical protein